MNTYLKQIKLKSRYREFAKVLNGVLQLTERELDLFSMLMYIDRYWPSKQKDTKNLLSRPSRKYIMDELNIMSSNLSHYIRKFKEKAIIIPVENSRKYLLNPLFKMEEENDTFKILFVLDFKNQ